MIFPGGLIPICNRLCCDIIFWSHAKMLSYCRSLCVCFCIFSFFFFLAWQLHRQLHQVLFRRSCKRREACVCSHRCVALTTESSALRRTMLWECGRKEWMHFKLQTSSSVAFGWWYACSCRFYSANQRFMHLSAKWVRLHQTPFSCVVVILLCWSQLQFILL